MKTRRRPRRHRHRILLHALFLLALPVPALAALDWYTVEVLVFTERNEAGIDEESWSTNPGAPELSGALQAGAGGEFEWLSASELELAAVSRQLDRSGRYRTLLLRGWRQPGYGPRGAVPVHLQSDPSLSLIGPAAGGLGGVTRPVVDRPAVEGLVRVSRSRYLHVLVDLLYARPETEVVAADGGMLAPAPTLYRLTHTRRMRSKEMHYYDHPLFGVLVKITPYGTQAESEPAEDPSAAEEDEGGQPPSAD